MKTTHTNTKYVKWLSNKTMHKNTLEWLSDLKFIKDEQLFFNDLIKSYTLQLIDSKHYNESKAIIGKLRDFEMKTNSLIDSVKTHKNDLKIMIDEIIQSKEEDGYIKEHRGLIIEISDFIKNYKTLKIELFKLIKSIKKEEKQKHLLNKN